MNINELFKLTPAAKLVDQTLFGMSLEEFNEKVVAIIEAVVRHYFLVELIGKPAPLYSAYRCPKHPAENDA